MYRDVEAAEKQCNELEKVVALVENNRQRFRHIDNVSDKRKGALGGNRQGVGG